MVADYLWYLKVLSTGFEESFERNNEPHRRAAEKLSRCYRKHFLKKDWTTEFGNLRGPSKTRSMNTTVILYYIFICFETLEAAGLTEYDNFFQLSGRRDEKYSSFGAIYF